jgi:hypothetical protein
MSCVGVVAYEGHAVGQLCLHMLEGTQNNWCYCQPCPLCCITELLAHEFIVQAGQLHQPISNRQSSAHPVPVTDFHLCLLAAVLAPCTILTPCTHTD